MIYKRIIAPIFCLSANLPSTVIFRHCSVWPPPLSSSCATRRASKALCFPLRSARHSPVKFSEDIPWQTLFLSLQYTQEIQKCLSRKQYPLLKRFREPLFGAKRQCSGRRIPSVSCGLKALLSRLYRARPLHRRVLLDTYRGIFREEGVKQSGITVIL